jgi:hypothetical protein
MILGIGFDGLFIFSEKKKKLILKISYDNLE